MDYNDLSKFFQDNNRRFTAPYGIIESVGRSKKGTSYKSITFGFARNLDATVYYYNRNFLIVDTAGPLSPQFERKYNSVESFVENLKKLIEPIGSVFINRH